MTETATRLRAMNISSKRLFGRVQAAYSDEWYTPPRIVQALGAFDLDPTAGPMNHALTNFRLANGECGLQREWFGRVWLNPPYSNVHLWLEKMASHANGIALVNARPDAQWFHKMASAAEALFWLKGRIKFTRPGGGALNTPVGSVLVAFGSDNVEALRNSGLAGLLTLIEP